VSIRLLLTVVLALSAIGAAGDLSAQSAGQPAQSSGQQGAEPNKDVGPRVIEIVAKRYAFEPSTIEAVVGEHLRLMVVSADGPHGLEIKKFKVKQQIPRGTEPVAIEFTPTEAGQFPILCSEYCGDGHNDMKGALVVKASGAPATTEKN